MSISGIVRFTLRSARFGLIAGALWLVFRLIRCRGRLDIRGEAKTLLFVIYAAMLAEIIALRGGSGGMRMLQMLPLRTTLGELRAGAWPFVYHLIGNMIWFVPLGIFLPMVWKIGLGRTLMLGAGISLTLEILQFALGSGVTDIDDVIINTLGTAAGWMIFRMKQRK